MSKTIAIIIPNWNGEDKLRRHLPKVLEAAKYGDVKEVIVSDDASTDGSVKLLKEEFPQVRLVKRGKNAGFASNVNFGVNHTDADLVVLLNSDASPVKDFIEKAAPHFDNPAVFSVGCNVGGLWATAYFKDGFFWHSQADKDKVGKIATHQTLWASGGSGFFRKEIWDKLGGLDTLFNPFYEEDVDLGYRATKRGYINIWEPESRVEHYKEEGVIAANFSQRQISQTAQRNQLIFIWKNITSEELINDHLQAMTKMLASHPRYWKVFLAALGKLLPVLRKRELEKRYAKLTDEEVLSIFAS